ncbi:uncharacterized protein Z518_03833 [Rhinocladiella mackenziei CBS 650.93]|uniref:Uncharacterized protein n=1 Tax=Rhinocladiella mackenziei CBS 650.93 TaxID=1442369 RepID=A0A0D2J9R0_9EURO|nr:uncharacterized protein Z518_03833 [Rhinocladiella mackenziei CBS 650.93]KIX05860.1 hypothetical protein Z518_03833 [Rhinocladiella mackenziei CBS 650.93]
MEARSQLRCVLGSFHWIDIAGADVALRNLGFAMISKAGAVWKVKCLPVPTSVFGEPTLSRIYNKATNSQHATNISNSIGITNSDTQLGLNGGLRPPACSCFIAWTICSAVYQNDGDKAASQAVVAFIWIFNCSSYELAWSGLLVAYTMEIIPCKIRAKGTSTRWDKGPTLEKIAKIFGGEDAEVGQVDLDKADAIVGACMGSVASATEKVDAAVEHRNVA